MPSQRIEAVTWKDTALNEAKRYLGASRNERVVFGFGRVTEKKGRRKMVIKTVLIPEDTDYLVSDPVHVKLDSAKVNLKIKAREESGQKLATAIHSQSMSEPSQGDVQSALQLVEFHPSLLIGTFCRGVIRFWQFDHDDHMTMLPWKVIETKRYGRQIKAFGEEGQFRLADSSVLCVACGGGMFKVITDLALAGVGSLTIIDPDRLEESNLARIPLSAEDIGSKKVEATARYIRGLRPEIDLKTYDGRVQTYDRADFAKHDVAVVGTDNVLSKIYCNRLAVQNQMPIVILGAGIEASQNRIEKMGGNCRVVLAGRTNCYECNKNFTAEQLQLDYMPPGRMEELRRRGYGITEPVVPAVTSLNSIVAGIGVLEVQKLLTDAAPPVAYTYFDALTNRSIDIKEPRDMKCPTCSSFWPPSDEDINRKRGSLFRRLGKRLLRHRHEGVSENERQDAPSASLDGTTIFS
jgi:molybdopterin/thiamine biosynthesis adenylyltransferase